jgi:hypothetical protein
MLMLMSAGEVVVRDRVLIVHGTLVRLWSGDRQTEHQCQQHARESHGPNIPRLQKKRPGAIPASRFR